jgi:arginase
MHGMPIAALLGEDNKDMQVNKPDDETIQYWEKIKNMGDIYPKVRYEDIVMVSVRDYERQEEFLLILAILVITFKLTQFKLHSSFLRSY